MGSGSGGGGGGGGGGNSSGGSGYSVSDSGSGYPSLLPRKQDTVGVAFNKLLAGPPKEYYMAIFGSDLLRELYAGIRDVSVWLCMDKDWRKIEQRYRVSPGPGCLVHLKDAMVRVHGGDSADPRVRELCLEALESLFIYAMGDSPRNYAAADGAKACQKLNRKVLIDSRSSYFMREMINEVAKHQSAELTAELRSDLYKYALDRADQIVNGFVRRFKDRDPEMTHNQIIQVIRDNPDWFLSLFKNDAV